MLGSIQVPLLPTERWWVASAVVVALAGCWRLRQGKLQRDIASAPWLLGAVTAFGVFLVSDAPLRRFGFFQDSHVCAELLLLGAAITICWRARSYASAGLAGIDSILSPLLLLFAQAVIAICFFKVADGRMIFSDDHPSFLYRLQLLQQQFPNIPFYGTAWEAGYSAREFFASGMLNFFFLTLPIWYSGYDLSNLDNAWLYNVALVWVFVIVIPWSVFLAAKVLRLPKTVAAVGGLLALGPSLGYFEWLLKYGTIGFCCSVGFVPLAFALFHRVVFDEEKPNAVEVAGLVIISFFVISWSLNILVFIPLVGSMLLRSRKLAANSRYKVIALTAVICIALNLRWMLIFVEESKVLSFVTKDALPGAPIAADDQTRGEDADRPAANGEPDQSENAQVQTDSGINDDDEALDSDAETAADAARKPSELSAKPVVSAKAVFKKRLSQLRAWAWKINPLVWLFFLPGLLVLKRRSLQEMFASVTLWLLLVASLGDWLKPQLELKRMLVVAAFVMLIPAAAGIVSLIERLELSAAGCRKKSAAVGRFAACALAFGGLFLSPLTVAAVYSNRSDEQFTFLPPAVPGLVAAIAEHGGPGRTFFLGFILHDLGASSYHQQDGGHIAPLAKWSNKPLFAFHQYHRSWNTGDPIPKVYRERGRAGVEEFLDLMNVTAVVTFKREWYVYCRDNPRYRQVFRDGRFRMFARKGPPEGFFVHGAGAVVERSDGFMLIPAADSIVLKFKWLPKLSSNYPEAVKIAPVPAYFDENEKHEVSFIGLEIDRSKLVPGKPLIIGYYPDESMPADVVAGKR